MRLWTLTFLSLGVGFWLVQGFVWRPSVIQAAERKAVCTPNLINRAGNDRWLMVCGYQGKLLQNSTLSAEYSSWSPVDTTLTSPHSFASTLDGEVVLVDNTDAHSVRWYRRSGDSFTMQGEFFNVGVRPHRVIYSARHEVFLVLGSQSATVTFFHLTAGATVVRGETLTVSALSGKYSRSFSLIDDYLYFVSDPGVVTQARFNSEMIEVIGTTPLPSLARSPNDIFRDANGSWYLSATPQVLLSASSLEAFGQGRFVNLYERLPMRGTPYYFSEQPEGFLIPYVTEASGALLRPPQGDFRAYFNFGY